MSTNELLLTIYQMNESRACLALKCKGKKTYKVVNIIDVLPFVGCLKQLSKAIDTGAEQDCKLHLRNADGHEPLLVSRFVKEIVAIELWFKEQIRFTWEGTAKEFRRVVDRMIAKLPSFF